jgi:hypothetical protein
MDSRGNDITYNAGELAGQAQVTSWFLFVHIFYKNDS